MLSQAFAVLVYDEHVLQGVLQIGFAEQVYWVNASARSQSRAYSTARQINCTYLLLRVS